MRLPLLAALLTAGCLAAPASETAEPAAAAPKVVLGERPDPTFGNVTTGPGAAPDLDAGLDRAPRLVPGEWWRIRFESVLTGETAEFVRVVAAVDGVTYVVGMPHEGWYKESVLYHAPGFGDVNADLSYFTHDVLFEPVRFPLTDDATWETIFSGGPKMKATVVTDPAARTAAITFTGTPAGLVPTGAQETTILEVVYDATIHEVREFRHRNMIYEVVEHGYGYEGWVTIPRGEDLVFFHGRAAGVLGLDRAPAAPLEEVEVKGGFNRLTFFQAVNSIAGTPGVYREKATAPDGTEYVTEAVPNLGFVMQIFEHANPDGVWKLEHAAGGAGTTFIEGIAYHQYDIRLPDGARRSDHAHPVVR